MLSLEKERAVLGAIVMREVEVILWERSLALLFEKIDLLKRARDMVTIIFCCCDWCLIVCFYCCFND